MLSSHVENVPDTQLTKSRKKEFNVEDSTILATVFLLDPVIVEYGYLELFSSTEAPSICWIFQEKTVILYVSLVRCGVPYEDDYDIQMGNHYTKLNKALRFFNI